MLKLNAATRLTASFDTQECKSVLLSIFPKSRPKVLQDTYAWVSIKGDMKDVLSTIKEAGWKEKRPTGANSTVFAKKGINVGIEVTYDEDKDGSILVIAR